MSIIFFPTIVSVVQCSVVGARGNPKECITVMCNVNAMCRHVLDNDLQLLGSKALYNLADQHEPNGIAIIQAGGPVHISSAMHMFPANTRLQILACAMLWILSESSVFRQGNVELSIG